MRLINIYTSLDTKGIIPVEFSKALIVTFDKVVDYQVVASAGDATGITSSDEIYKKIEAFFSQDRRQPTISVVGKVCASAAEVKTFLDEVRKDHKDFFFVMQDVFNEEKSKGKNEWCVSNNLIPWDLTPSKSMDADAVVTYIKTLNNNTCVIDGDDYEDAKLLGYASTFLPGYHPWSWRELKGVQPTKRTLAEQQKFFDASVNFINEERRGLYVTVPGKTAYGEFIKNEWGKANLNDDLHISISNLLKSENPPSHPGADESGATSMETVMQNVIKDYASPTRKFIAKWSDKEASLKPVISGTPKAWVEVKTEYQENDIKLGKFEISWAATPRGECLYGTVSGILTFNEETILSGGGE